MVGLGLSLSLSPGLEEGGWVSQRCSLLGPGISGLGKQEAGLALAPSRQVFSPLWDLKSFMPGDLHVPGGNELGGGLFGGENVWSLPVGSGGKMCSRRSCLLSTIFSRLWVKDTEGRVLCCCPGHSSLCSGLSRRSNLVPGTRELKARKGRDTKPA